MTTSTSSKCISIRLAGVNKIERAGQDHPYTKFKFFTTDSKDDIHQEISKAFSVENFSLVDEREGHIITGAWFSLENNNTYSLIKRVANVAKKKCDQETIPCKRCVKYEIECNLSSEI
ncbi:15499_t:CDS:2 [Racocetra fulgida]|uniref:15499_t:CDS:1 n=1 Tax=Racocetra fulgida TaxID=60492 RepID=A0A9N8ZZH7_9GLOM|nr:15499_t:CDS:2 [Racocetra fulgida]